MVKGGGDDDDHTGDRRPERHCDSVRIPRLPLPEAKRLKKDDEAWTPERINELGEEGWEAVGLSLKYGDLMAWPVVLLKRPLA